MKKKSTLIVLFSLLIAQSPSRGLVGGPFDNNQVPGNGSDGTYSAVITGDNLTGIATFGIGSSSGFEGNGRFAVFHEGAVHYGAVSANADLANRRVAGALLGVAGLPTETTGASGTTTTAGQALTVRSSAEGAFNAIIKGYPQQILFEGPGELSSTANSAVVTAGSTAVNPTVLILPVRPDNEDQNSDTDIFRTTSASTPSVTRSTTPFKIRGSRTSTTPFTALNSFTALPPLVPASPTAAPTATATP